MVCIDVPMDTQNIARNASRLFLQRVWKFKPKWFPSYVRTARRYAAILLTAISSQSDGFP
jgi:hypothetical protein